MGRIRDLLTNGNAKEKEFLRVFRQHAWLAGQGAQVLTGTFKHDLGLQSGLLRIDNIEHEGDALVRETRQLLKTFIPPFDRDHIRMASDELDDILDGMKTTLRTVERYDMGDQPMRQEAVDFCSIITQGATHLFALFEAFPKISRDEIDNKIHAIDQLEDTADDLLDRALKNVFGPRGQTDRVLTVEMRAWEEIFSCLEEVTDHCDHAAQLLSDIARWQGI